MAMNNRVLSIEIGNSFTKICEMDYKVKKPKVYKVLTVETPEASWWMVCCSRHRSTQTIW